MSERAMPVRGDLLRDRNFIGGIWRDAREDAWLEVADPASGAVIGRVPDSTAADARDAAHAASDALSEWRATTARVRAQLLKRWHARILASSEDLARIISLEQGKPLGEALGEVAYGASYVEWFAEGAVRAYGDIIPAGVAGRRMMVVKEPLGVVAAVTPWNFPLAMLARKAAPALAAGCTVVAKPAEDTPLTALALARLAEEAGLPAGTVNVVTASRANTAGTVAAWLADPRVRKVTFTGSTAVGKELARGSADTLKKLSLELGGNAPFIVFEDADITAAVDGLMRAKFRNGWDNPQPLTANEVTAVNYEMPDINHTFRRDHRIMVQIQSSWFPLVDLSPQTFTDIPKAKLTDFKSATERVYHSAEHASAVVVGMVR